ncbi:hypothetical protein EDB81DRAFT_185259 [Dactylonectria macrodidyma]|uniref:Uncharacterized protein n=1 Tax=Dactylonectria macrodidyma TaxID=307937 RepID=A0A9P9FQY0_9HYPO|nr:hypothetical protein EDB81DRAFT_185259 [Dactylonectria macrodidyma]
MVSVHRVHHVSLPRFAPTIRPRKPSQARPAHGGPRLHDPTRWSLDQRRRHHAVYSGRFTYLVLCTEYKVFPVVADVSLKGLKADEPPADPPNKRGIVLEHGGNSTAFQFWHNCDVERHFAELNDSHHFVPDSLRETCRFWTLPGDVEKIPAPFRMDVRWDYVQATVFCLHQADVAVREGKPSRSTLTGSEEVKSSVSHTTWLTSRRSVGLRPGRKTMQGGSDPCFGALGQSQHILVVEVTLRTFKTVSNGFLSRKGFAPVCDLVGVREVLRDTWLLHDDIESAPCSPKMRTGAARQ